MNKKLNYWLMAALVCSLALSVTSCKDDDKDENNEPSNGKTDEQVEQDMADAAVFWGVVGQLSDTPMPDDWKNATYEPAIGQPDGTNSAIRIVSCTDEESAAARAADLLGADITTETADYTYQNDIVGTLTYRKTGGASLATVDVSIKQMPGLSQIIYKTPEQMGQNASFSGTAYYRFGDVVTKTNSSGKTEYWVCIRPSFNPAGKGESHWISVSKLPNENILPKENKYLKDGSKVTFNLPKNLVSSQEYMVDLAELLYAMTDARQWAYNLIKDDGYKKLKYLWDFDFKKRFEYHDHTYFDRLGEEWEKKGLFKGIFGLNREEMKQHLATKGLSMLWKSGTLSGNDVTLEVTRYDGMNLKTKHDFKATSRWESKAFDINTLIGDKGYIDDPGVVGAGDRYWVVRYASGATLAKGNEAGGYDVHKRMPNCTDEFLYNQVVEGSDMTVQTLKDTPPSNSLDGIFDEHGYYLCGDVLLDKNGCRWICVQGIPHVASDVELTKYKDYMYAYFVSFDRDAVGDQLKNVPKKQLAMQMLFVMEVGFHDALLHWNKEENARTYVMENIKNYAGVAMEEIIAVRDTLHKFTADTKAHYIQNNYMSTVYKDTDGKLCVLRLVADYTAEQTAAGQAGKRDFSWHFYDAYTKGLKTRMLLSDLADQSKVDTYSAYDEWIYLPWAELDVSKGFLPMVTATTGPRTDTEDLTDLMRLIYESGRKYTDAEGTVPFDMYRDPLVPFAVKRVKDTRQPLSAFDDGTTFYHWGRIYNLNPNFFAEGYRFESSLYLTYQIQQNQEWLNDKLYHWGMTNAVK